ncbi:hypothetical protein JMJ77_0009355 [Colletotrichum scovillei]|uniref:Uncharacterized protein n=1 Tax=Colletotrichum scovillei TaxID=1209932 RepID=A0A9P7R0E0_9PEZI|nr:hypothetical protein JMJ77_0009355 [Colletotrichum scovillei]KAG7052434.1 hypothetical protein JMJ78_0005451 [Colletotrichum scovillei]KAG7064723.1 hypothetical protein JMJ76_0012482 [Colletotrichum scovillei]
MCRCCNRHALVWFYLLKFLHLRNRQPPSKIYSEYAKSG